MTVQIVTPREHSEAPLELLNCLLRSHRIFLIATWDQSLTFKNLNSALKKKKKGNSDICYMWMNLEEIMISENIPVAKGQLLCDSIDKRYLTRSTRRDRKWSPGAWGRENGEFLFRGYGVQFCKVKEF